MAPMLACLAAGMISSGSPLCGSPGGHHRAAARPLLTPRAGASSPAAHGRMGLPPQPHLLPGKDPTTLRPLVAVPPSDRSGPGKGLSQHAALRDPATPESRGGCGRGCQPRALDILGTPLAQGVGDIHRVPVVTTTNVPRVGVGAKGEALGRSLYGF